MPKRIAVSLLIILSALAVGGGVLLIIDPTGARLGITDALLEGSIFDSYLIPGIVLFGFIGCSSFFIAISSLLNMKYYYWFIAFQGLMLIVWLTIEVIINDLFFQPFYHFPLYLVGGVLIILGFVLRIKESDKNLLLPEEVGSY